MIELANNKSTAAKTLSFETILNWFGRFTPQFKKYLAALQRTKSPNEFQDVAQQLISIFRRYLHQLSQQPAGAMRAVWLHQQIEVEMSRTQHQKISCGNGCGACCRLEKQITNDEADLLAHVIEGGLEIDRQRLASQALRYKNGQTWGSLQSAENTCVFLGADQSCRVYAYRPAVCRKHLVTSPAEECGKDDGKITPAIEIFPELLTSAAISLPDNDFGPMSLKIYEALNYEVVTAAPDEQPSPSF